MTRAAGRARRAGLIACATLAALAAVALAFPPARRAVRRAVVASPPAAEAALGRRMASFRADGVPLEQALGQWAGQAGVRLSVDWKMTAPSEADRAAPVRVRVFDLTAAQVLDAVLHAADVRERLRHTTRGDAVVLFYVGDLARYAEMRTYDLGDLLDAELARDAARDFEAARGSGGGPAAISNGQGLWSDPAVDDEAQSRAEWADEVADLVCEAVDPDGWPDTPPAKGAAAAAVTPLVRRVGDRLLVAQTPENHRRIEALLRELRASAAVAD